MLYYPFVVITSTLDNVRGCVVGITNGKYFFGMTSDDMTYVPSFITIGSGIRVIRVLPQQFERL
jgi:hypothetical protein